MSTLATKWTSQFFATLGDDRLAADALRDASVRFDLARWTATLTGVVVRSFEALGWAAAGKGHRCTVLPVKRNEYLSQDVMAFLASSAGWRFPVAVCELENSVGVDLVRTRCGRCSAFGAACALSSATGPTPQKVLRSSRHSAGACLNRCLSPSEPHLRARHW